MYFRDHLPPHFHAAYNEHEVLVEINTLKVHAGSLPTKQMKIINNWAIRIRHF